MCVVSGAMPARRHGVHKQVFLYGRLDPARVELDRSFSSNWGMSGWMMSAFPDCIDATVQEALKQRALCGLPGMFATGYARTVSLPDLLQPQTLAHAAGRATGGKLLIDLTA